MKHSLRKKFNLLMLPLGVLAVVLFVLSILFYREMYATIMKVQLDIEQERVALEFDRSLKSELLEYHHVVTENFEKHKLKLLIAQQHSQNVLERWNQIFEAEKQIGLRVEEEGGEEEEEANLKTLQGKYIQINRMGQKVIELLTSKQRKQALDFIEKEMDPSAASISALVDQMIRVEETVVRKSLARMERTGKFGMAVIISFSSIIMALVLWSLFALSRKVIKPILNLSTYFHKYTNVFYG